MAIGKPVKILSAVLFLIWELSIGTHVDCHEDERHSALLVKLHPVPAKRSVAEDELRRKLLLKVRTLPTRKLNGYKLEAATHLQANLVRAFRTLSTNVNKVPPKIRLAARKAMITLQAGKLRPTIVHHLGPILQQTSLEQGRPAEQLESVLTTLIPHVPVETRAPLQGILGFVSSNLAGVNELLAGVLGEVPNLLAGVITSLTNSLGAVTGAAIGTVGSLGALLGGIL